MDRPLEDERGRWDRRYAEGAHGPPEPDGFFLAAYAEFVAPLFPQAGSALDVAGGTGRHAIWLAQQGWRVTLLDVSSVGLERARNNAGEWAENIDFQTADLRQFSADRQYDLILVFFYLQREIFSELIRALRPGGLLLYKTYTRDAPKYGKGPTHPMHLLEPNELLRAFRELNVLHYRETVRDRAVAELVARKLPADI